MGNYLRLITFLVLSVGLQDFIRRILVIHYHQRLINSVEFLAFCAYLAGAVVAIRLGWGISGVLLVNIASKFIILFIFLLYSRPYFRPAAHTLSIPAFLKTPMRGQAIF